MRGWFFQAGIAAMYASVVRSSCARGVLRWSRDCHASMRWKRSSNGCSLPLPSTQSLQYGPLAIGIIQLSQDALIARSSPA
jgi:hypothetical protein